MNPEDIRVAVAEEMEWRCFAGHDWVAPSDPFESRYTQELPQYTTSCDAALELVEKLRGEGWSISIDSFHDVWDVTFNNINEERTIPVCGAPTLPMAICLGFLKVRGHTV